MTSGGASTGIEVRDLSVAFGDRSVLDGVSLDVPSGETLAVLGPSGGGKTTLLRVIAGLHAPEGGRVLLDGHDVTDVPTHRRRVGLVFQDHALWPHRDVAGNVGFGLKVAGVDRAGRRRRVAEVLGLVGLAGFERRRVSDLSGGEAQRVALARSLAPEPTVLLLDEPLGALDRLLHGRLLEDLSRIIEGSGLTVVHVTHDHGEAMALGDRVAVLGGGRVLQVDEPEVLWRNPVDEEVARFLGHRNILEVEVREGVAWWCGRPLVEVDAPPGPGRLVVRAEGVRVSAADPDDVGDLGVVGNGASGPFPLRGSVDASTFTGAATEVAVRLDGPSADQVTLHTTVRGRPPRPGSEVTVQIDPSGCSMVAW